MQLSLGKRRPVAAGWALPEGRGLAVRLCPLDVPGTAGAAAAVGAIRATGSADGRAAAALSRGTAAGSGGACGMRTSTGGRAARLLAACPPLPRPPGGARSRDRVVEATRGGGTRAAPGCSSAAQAGRAPASCRAEVGGGPAE